MSLILLVDILFLSPERSVFFLLGIGNSRSHGVSLCHLSNDIFESSSTSEQETLAFSHEPQHHSTNFQQIDLPKGSTDWDAKMRHIMSENN